MVLNLVIVVCLVESAGFVALYAVRSGWWRTEVGRLVMALVGTNAGLLGMRMLARAVGPLGDLAWTVAFGVLAAAYAGLLRALWRAQASRAGARER